MEGIKIVKIGGAEIWLKFGEFDKCQVVIYYYGYSRMAAKTIRYKPKKKPLSLKIMDWRLYLTFIEIITGYSGHQKDWKNYINALFNIRIPLLIKMIERDEFGNDNIVEIVNPRFISEVENAILEHNWIISIFNIKFLANNGLKEIWPRSFDNIFGFSIIALLIGYGRDHLYNRYEDPRDVPISAALGRLMTKDCLFKIINGVYYDFHRKYRDFYNTGYFNYEDVSKLHKKGEIEIDQIDKKGKGVNQIINMINEKYAQYLVMWQKHDKERETKNEARYRIVESFEDEIQKEAYEYFRLY